MEEREGFDDAMLRVEVEICLTEESTADRDVIRQVVTRLLESKICKGPIRDWYKPGLIVWERGFDDVLDENVQSISFERGAKLEDVPQLLLFWQIALSLHVFQLSHEEPDEELDEGEGTPFCKEWALPHRTFQGLWESLYYEDEIKSRLLQFATSALLFSDHGVDPQLITWNRVVLLHGPPGTGKTSLCKALAQKLAIKFSDRFPTAVLLEVNAHSLFSKWFSESGKLVSKLFSKIHEILEDEDMLVFILIDEVESLTSSRQAAVSGSEPSDAIRVVNALLTQLDSLKHFSNSMTLTTSNITEAVDGAFLDRADIKAYIGNPTQQARYEILRSAIHELQRCKLIVPETPLVSFNDWQKLGNDQDRMALDSGAFTSVQASGKLFSVCTELDGVSGRLLRKLPFLTHAALQHTGNSSHELAYFMQSMKECAQQEMRETTGLGDLGLS